MHNVTADAHSGGFEDPISSDPESRSAINLEGGEDTGFGNAVLFGHADNISDEFFA
jgi:hypothetical protein